MINFYVFYFNETTLILWGVYLNGYIIKLLLHKIKLDPLDPLTEIVKNGEAFSPLIFIERIIWLFIGFFFIGAISSGITKGMRVPDFFNKSFTFGINKKENKKNDQMTRDTKKNISKN